MAGILLVPPPWQVVQLPPGIYGISFDLISHAMSDPLPDGWGLRSRSCIYTRIQTRLEGAHFDHVQGSVYQRVNTFAMAAWAHMLALRSIEPLGIIPTISRALQMFHIPTPVMIVSDNVRLGGAFSPIPVAPTPINLIPAFVAAVPLLHAPNPLPRNVRDTAEAQHGPNWAQ